MLEIISSIKDERIILAREIKSRQGRQKRQKILLEGEEIIDWAIGHALSIEYLLVCNKESSSIAEKYLPKSYKIFTVSEGILKKVTDTNYVIPVVGVAQIPAKRLDSKPQFMVVLDAVKDFGNIGTIIRTCQAFGIRNLISTTHDMDIYNRKTIEASRGNVFSTHLDTFRNAKETIEHLKREGFQIVATSPRGMALQSLAELKQQPVALVVGNETDGVSAEVEQQADFLLQIPMSPAIESLNVGVAAGISIYEIKLKQVLTMIEERIKSTLGRELNLAGVFVQQALDAELRKVSKLSSQQVIFMMVLKCDRTMPVEAMCRQFGILESEVEEFLDPLIRSGLVVMNKEIELTYQGEEVLAKLWPVVERAEEMILSNFSAEETKMLIKQLHHIQEKCLKMVNGK
ncbi:MAG: TrmH family RNA methyltransferase [Anaerolineaceae bacterium]|jgi:TrmH family RNA methyltransferase